MAVNGEIAQLLRRAVVIFTGFIIAVFDRSKQADYRRTVNKEHVAVVAVIGIICVQQHFTFKLMTCNQLLSASVTNFDRS